MTGYYLEGGYNLYADKNTNDELILFVRYENYNTHDEMEEGFESNLSTIGQKNNRYYL